MARRSSVANPAKDGAPLGDEWINRLEEVCESEGAEELKDVTCLADYYDRAWKPDDPELAAVHAKQMLASFGSTKSMGQHPQGPGKKRTAFDPQPSDEEQAVRTGGRALMPMY